MHSPRPYGLLVLDGELSNQDQLFIDQELKILTNNKSQSNLESIRQVKNLPDGGYVILQDMGGILKAIAYKGMFTQTIQFDGLIKFYVPMLFSGVITHANVRAEQGVGIKLTEQCRRRLNNYSINKLPPKKLFLKRFVIEPHPVLATEFAGDGLSDVVTTQYAEQHPTWYSGAMSEVMQISGGYGIQVFNFLPEDNIEQAKYIIPPKYLNKIFDELHDVRLPCYSGIPPVLGQFQFDYKFYHTNGVVFDNESKPWLIKIDPSGVWAMPMPIIPVTATQAFREYIESVNDIEILKILDRFGALPSGEGMPLIQQDFYAWKRAGVIIKVCDSSDFYEHIAYSDACGWTFNSSGTECFNTAYSVNEDGLKFGVAYKAKFNFKAADRLGWLSKIDIIGKNASIVSKYLSSLLNLLPKGEQKTLAILYKLRRVSKDDIFQLAQTSLADPMGVTSVDVDYWHNLELTPIAQHTGKVVKVGQGYLFHNALRQNQPQIKFPNVGRKGCISFDFSPVKSVDKSSKPNCDTIMYGYYVEDSLKVVKYFVDWRSYIAEYSGNFERIMIVGSWEQLERVGSTSLQGYFYTSDLDYRETFSPTEIKTTIIGEDKGFDTKPHFSFLFPGSCNGEVWRNRYFTHKTITTTYNSESIAIGICIPFFDRNSILLAKKKATSSTSNHEQLELLYVQDPYKYIYWTYDFVYAWVGPIPKRTGKPEPVNGNPVWVEIEQYNPTEFSDFADQGAWLPTAPYDITWLVHPDSNQWNYNGGGTIPKVKEYSKTEVKGAETTGDLSFSVIDQAYKVFAKLPDEGYFTTSPNNAGNLFYKDACRVVFGDSVYANISELDQNNRRYKWGYSALVDDKSAYHFIGVINE
ncbi:hypothetical protein F900_01062 [Acinetobacter modestus]|uniref:Uncharacterized protein n=1 Tax=Acinetobacter modestus TaxID=1776740 RepID=N9NAF4_9GAMM|nr:hypothetical protein [Acinetobacter modestus]ENX02616.1 hypothetical protein F900_01062 [Acinetobacter modestus]